MTIAEQCQGFTEETIKLARVTHLNLPDAADFFRCLYVRSIIEECRGNRSQAAKILGIHRNTLCSFIRAMRARGFSVVAGQPGNQRRRKSVVDHKGIALRRSQAAWRNQQ